MKLFKRLTINGEIIPLVSEDIRLQLNTPGRASFVVSKPVERGVISFDIGYKKETIYRYFYGYIESVTKIDEEHYSIFCQEFGAVLNRRITTNIQHVTLKDVVQELAKQTALKFIVPDKPYSKTLTACFYSTGGGYHCMDSLEDIFSIDQYVWQQQTDGKIFVGSWDDSRWKDRTVAIADKWLVKHGVGNSATMPIVPTLRPGVEISGRGLITKTAFKNDSINLSWSDKFWKKPLKSW